MSLEKENEALTTKNSSQTDAFCSDGENSDGATFGQSLIKFMTLATGSVKTALQKPVNYKKKKQPQTPLTKTTQDLHEAKETFVESKNRTEIAQTGLKSSRLLDRVEYVQSGMKCI